jgi:tetratricopeptide (TPR) repeat protein
MPQSTGNDRPPDRPGRRPSTDRGTDPRAASADDNLTSLAHQAPFDDPDLTALPIGPEVTPHVQPDAADVTRYEPAPAVGRLSSSRPSVPSAPKADTVAEPSNEGGPLAVGQPFGPRYHITKVLGVGGMGAVYQAWDAELGVDVAVKVIRPEIAADPAASSEIERRFKRELLLARQVTHPNIIRIHDLGDIDGIKYITMPFIDGSDLATILKQEKKLRVPRALLIARGTVSGLVSAHQAGVIHRDLKPANIMIGWDDTPTIMDFGIARSAGGPGQAPPPSLTPIRAADLSRTAAMAASSTMAGAIVGTVAYMAPEQARGEEVDQRVDIYAFGLIMYDMVIGGRRSERAPSAIAELQQRMQTAPPPPRSIDPTIPEAVDEIIRRCLEPDAAKRFQTTVELQEALDRLDEKGELLPIIRRVSLKMLIASVAVMLVALAGAWYYALQLVVPVEQGLISVLIADFQNGTNDPVFEGSLEHALTVSLEGTSFIQPFDRYEARRIAERRLNRGRTLNDETSRAVAGVEGIKLLLAGSITPDDDGYTVAVRGIDASSGKHLWTEQARAEDKESVLAAIGEVAADVKEQLGDSAGKTERLAAANVLASRSIDALRDYSLAQDLLLSNRPADAAKYYERAVTADPNFGRAYANWGLAAYTLGRTDEAQTLWKTALSLVDRMTEQEKYNTLSTYYATIVGNYEKAIEYYEMLIELSPFDARVHNNLAIAYFRTRNFAKATEEARKAVQIYQGNVNRRINLTLYAMYAGHFEMAVQQAEEIIKEAPGRHQTYLPIAMAEIIKGDFDLARIAYERMAQTGPQGASLAATGLADLAMYRGNYAEAEAILNTGIEADRAGKHTAGLTAKLIALAETYEATGRIALAIKTAREATAMSTEEAVLLPTALLLLRARQPAEAESIAADLDNQLQTQTRASAKVIDGKVALLKRRRASAIDAFREAAKFGDPWIARFEMGITYIEAERFAEGFAELDMCMKRRGEVTAMFLDDSPTIRYLSTLPYWLGRAQEGLGQKEAAATSFTSFVSSRSAATDDPLVVDARKRLGS